MSENKQPDWDKITEGKIRHGFAVSAFSTNKPMTRELCAEIECWVRYVVDGKVPDKKEQVKEVKDKPKPKSNVSFTGLLDKIAVKKTDEEHIAEIIVGKVGSLKESDKEKVLKSLKDGHITKANLDSCLERIHDLASANAKL